jgi:hypothetical protein
LARCHAKPRVRETPNGPMAARKVGGLIVAPWPKVNSEAISGKRTGAETPCPLAAGAWKLLLLIK